MFRREARAAILVIFLGFALGWSGPTDDASMSSAIHADHGAGSLVLRDSEGTIGRILHLWYKLLGMSTKDGAGLVPDG